MNWLFNDIEDIIDMRYKKRFDLIKKLVGSRIIDILLFLPSYTVRKKYISSPSTKNVNEIIATKVKPLYIETGRSKAYPTKVTCLAGEIYVQLIFFNKFRLGYINSFIRNVQEIIVCGKLTKPPDKELQFVHPEIITNLNMWKDDEKADNVYPLITGVDIYFLKSVIKNALLRMENAKILEWIPQDILEKNNWVSFKKSVEMVHNPKNVDDTTLEGVYVQRLCFDECLAEQIAKKISNMGETHDGYPIKNEKVLYKKLIEKLTFNLTEDQISVLNSIEEDMASGKRRMSRLLQGDVGSGKTIVALLAATIVIESGYQVALLAPTEILARQHYELFLKLLDGIGINISILTSFEKGKKRTAILENLVNGTTNIIVGTHAIISESVTFCNLGFVIVDEQHRFGVNQRLMLINKGKTNPHILSMTATPIPRTLILSVHGDIDVSTIKMKPAGRTEIITTTVPMDKIFNVITSIRRIIEKGEKVYWVCPLIEESEKLDYTCVINRYNFLYEIFQDDVIMMHGRMKEAERREIFDSFREGTKHILVSTTIIEIGVDIPNATVIVIENAEKFGLSQLHQLRGRVGRSNLKSFCVLLYDKKISNIQRERLDIIRRSTDGFYIADQDLLIRGAGEVLGTKQSGFKKYKTFDIDDIEHKETIYRIMSESAQMVSKIVDFSKYDYLLKIFILENFEDMKQSF
ncbi:MAG: ATP-dependent DNA helicase RecG [Holosporales bacterium]|jgi:ATP-dependent DNA helicase RecG|nr:ATP-dependent DNA helicase RecG [Holosporales bacterium]